MSASSGGDIDEPLLSVEEESTAAVATSVVSAVNDVFSSTSSNSGNGGDNNADENSLAAKFEAASGFVGLALVVGSVLAYLPAWQAFATEVSERTLRRSLNRSNPWALL